MRPAYDWSTLSMAALPERLKEIRLARGLTQVRLAELLEVSPRVYNRWEKGIAAPHLDTVIQIANILQVNLDELVGRQPLQMEFAIHNHRLHTLVGQIDQLPDEDQKALIILLDSLVKRQKMEKVIGQ
jgi:transcriptional regulator with XRE-family HTH domain